ncbi:MAG: mechanosensitive ion channel family protein, partial [Maribacter dokdonensis]
IYAFSSDKRWENYEYVMADIFDHLLAALPYFHLQVYEIPVSISAVEN